MRICGPTGQTLSSAFLLPPDANRDRAQVGCDVVVLAVKIAKLGIEIHIRPNFAGDSAAKIFSELIHTGMQELAADGQVRVIAVSPPLEECVASGTRNSGGRIELARAMIKGWTCYDVPAPVLADRDIDDRAEHQ